MTASTVAGFDTETHLISASQIIPRLVCATFDVAPAGSYDGDAWIVPNSDPTLVSTLLDMLKKVQQREAHLVIQHIGFDFPVIMRYATDVMSGQQVGNVSDAEEMYRLAWEVLDQGMDDELAGNPHHVHDTMIREKLLNLSTHGSIDAIHGREARYGLGDMVKSYYNLDITAKKVEMRNGRIYTHDGLDITGTAAAGAAWRLRYSELDGKPLSQWPIEAQQYAIDDATWARRVFDKQEEIRRPRYHSSANSESLQVYASIALALMGSVGFPIDTQQLTKVEARIHEQLGRVESFLKMNGLLRVDGSKNMEIVRAHFIAAWAQKGAHPLLTNGGDVATSSEALEELKGISPLLDMFSDYQSMAKLRDAFIPRLKGGRVWAVYDILKETGRTSCKSGEDGRSSYPAENVQQQPRFGGIRECHLPPTSDPILPSPEPTRWVLLSCDYSALELCSVAQVTYSLFGYSVHREKINQGYDLHSYLGSAMSMVLAPDVVDGATNHEQAYKTLRANAKAKLPPDDDKSPEAERVRALKEGAGKYRTFAKPTGLGYPGGLGENTFVSYAKATYELDVTFDQARIFRELWRRTYPEMTDFFQWVNKCAVDPQCPGDGLYAYETQGFNRFRARATYCATANGKSMQSLSADGAKRAVCWSVRAMLGGITKDSPYILLKGMLPAAFIHDEILAASPDDVLLTERALLLSRLMVDAMQVSMPDVLLNVEPAAMRRWTKKAEPEWVVEPDREARVMAAIRHIYGGEPPTEWWRELVRLLGPTYDPTKRLIPWDDKHAIKDLL